MQVKDKGKEEIKRERLEEFFKDNLSEWLDVKEEINQCLINAMNTLRSPSCGSRDYYAGKCSGLQEVLDLERQFTHGTRKGNKTVKEAGREVH